MEASEIKIDAVFKEEAKKELGNKDGFYDGTWRVMKIDFREKTVDLSNGRISIFRNFDDVDLTILNFMS